MGPGQRVLKKWEKTPDVVPTPVPRPANLVQNTAPPAPGAFDSVFELLANDDHQGAMDAAASMANSAHESGQDTSLASLARDVARAMADATLAVEEERFGDAKDSAHDAARFSRFLRDNDHVVGSLSDPVIARAGEIWTRANAAERSSGNRADIALLEGALPLRRGARGAAVEALQRLLGMDAGGGLGNFGPATERAVKEFQSRHGLGNDGVVGSGTLDKLRG